MKKDFDRNRQVVSIAAGHGKQKIVKQQVKWEQKRLSEISRKPFGDGFQNRR